MAFCSNSGFGRLVDTDVIYTGPSITCGGTTVNPGDTVREFISVVFLCANDIVVNVEDNSLPIPDGTGNKVSFVGSGTYTQSGGPDIVVPSGHMGILNWDGSVWYLGSSVDMPDNSAKIAEWEAGTYGQDEVVTVDDVIYRAKEQTSEEPPSDKWEVIGGSGSAVDGTNLVEITDSEGGVMGYWNGKGRFYTKYLDGSIPQSALEIDLEPDVENLKDVIQDSHNHSLLEFTDSDGGLLGKVTKDGTWHLPKVREFEGGGSEDEDAGDEVRSVVVTERYLDLPDFNFFRLDIEGPDIVAGISGPNNVGVTISDGKTVYARLNATIKRQGTGSAFWNPSNLTIDFYNDKWKSVKVRFGDWVALDSYQIKAYQSDKTHTRDNCGGLLWRSFVDDRTYPKNLIKPLLELRDNYDGKEDMQASALFYGATRPCEVWSNGEFRNLGSLKIKKSRDNYAINRDNQNHWFFDADIYQAYIGRGYDWESLNTFYDIKSPRNITQETQNAILDWFDWAKGVVEGDVDLAATAEDRLDLISWIDFVIFVQVVGHWDTNGNNLLFGSYDGQRMTTFIHDLDRTLGIGSEPVIIETQTGMVSTDAFAVKIREVFEDLVKARYTELRNKELISMDAFVKIYGGHSARIPKRVYDLDSNNRNGQSKYATIDHIYNYAKSRIDYLDGVWLT